MPFEVIDTLDPIAPLIRIRTSAVYEMVISLQTLVKPARRQEDWAAHTAKSLAPALLKELTELYKSASDGGLYFELPVDYQDHDDVPGFCNYVAHLSDASFLFYLLGRTIPPAELAPVVHDIRALQILLNTTQDLYEWYGRAIEPILNDVAAYRSRLAAAWGEYWTTFFQYEIGNFAGLWAAGLQDKRNMLEREGGRQLLEKVTGRSDWPPEIPAGMPFSSIDVIPVALLPSRAYRFFGYGNITILFNPQYSEESKAAANRVKADLLNTLKALNDETRLEILRFIVQSYHGNLHGKLIAEKIGYSPSAISRHLALLKEGNLIEEEPLKNLVTYRFRKDTIMALVDKLLDYLYS